MSPSMWAGYPCSFNKTAQPFMGTVCETGAEDRIYSEKLLHKGICIQWNPGILEILQEIFLEIVESLLWGCTQGNPSGSPLICLVCFLPGSAQLHLKLWYQRDILLKCYCFLQCWAATLTVTRKTFICLRVTFPECRILPAKLVWEGEGPRSCDHQLGMCWMWRFKCCKYPVPRPKVIYKI